VTGSKTPYELRWRSPLGAEIEVIHIHLGLEQGLAAFEMVYQDKANVVEVLIALYFAVGTTFTDNDLANEKATDPQRTGGSVFYHLRTRHDLLETTAQEPFEVKGAELFSAPVVTQRIRAQSGFFTIQGDPHLPLTAQWSRHRLRRYVIPFESRETLRSELLIYGINHAFVFSDLDGLSRQLQEELND
jgi:hypothetical protein